MALRNRLGNFANTPHKPDPTPIPSRFPKGRLSSQFPGAAYHQQQQSQRLANATNPQLHQPSNDRAFRAPSSSPADVSNFDASFALHFVQQMWHFVQHADVSRLFKPSEILTYVQQPHRFLEAWLRMYAPSSQIMYSFVIFIFSLFMLRTLWPWGRSTSYAADAGAPRRREGLHSHPGMTQSDAAAVAAPVSRLHFSVFMACVYLSFSSLIIFVTRLFEYIKDSVNSLAPASSHARPRRLDPVGAVETPRPSFTTGVNGDARGGFSKYAKPSNFGNYGTSGAFNYKYGGLASGDAGDDEKEFEERAQRRNMQLSPNRRAALDPTAPVDRASMQLALEKDRLELGRINAQFGRGNSILGAHQDVQGSNTSNHFQGGSMGSPHSRGSRRNRANSAVTGMTGMTGITGVTGVSAGRAPSRAETDYNVARTMADMRREQRDTTPIRDALRHNFTPQPRAMETPAFRRNAGNGQAPRSRTPQGRRSRLVGTIDENGVFFEGVGGVGANRGMGRMGRMPGMAGMAGMGGIGGVGAGPVPMSIDRSLGGMGPGAMSKDDSFLGSVGGMYGAGEGFGSSWGRRTDGNASGMQFGQDHGRMRAMLNDGGMYGNINLRAKEIVTLQPSGLASPFSRRADIEGVKQREGRDRKNRGSYEERNEKERKRRTQFRKDTLEKASELYRAMDIEAGIHNWTSNMRWWMYGKLGEKYKSWKENNGMIVKLFESLNEWYPNYRQQFASYPSFADKCQFVVQNQSKLESVAAERQAPMISQVVQRRVLIEETAKKVDENTHYIFERLEAFVQSTNLNSFKYDSGQVSGGQRWQPDVYPCDCEILMNVFCEYMDSIFCPAFKFSERNFVIIKHSQMQSWKLIGKHFRDVAIVQVLDEVHSIRINGEQRAPKRANINQIRDTDIKNTHEGLPYYFVVYDKEKYEKKIEEYMERNKENYDSRGNRLRKPKHYLNQKSGESDYYGTKRRNENRERQNRERSKIGFVRKVGAWYPQPGKDNVFQCLVLFALFLHKFNDSKLGTYSLQDHNCDILSTLMGN